MPCCGERVGVRSNHHRRPAQRRTARRPQQLGWHVERHREHDMAEKEGALLARSRLNRLQQLEEEQPAPGESQSDGRLGEAGEKNMFATGGRWLR